jgi:hypothetical protein
VFSNVIRRMVRAQVLLPLKISTEESKLKAILPRKTQKNISIWLSACMGSLGCRVGTDRGGEGLGGGTYNCDLLDCSLHKNQKKNICKDDLSISHLCFSLDGIVKWKSWLV